MSTSVFVNLIKGPKGRGEPEKITSSVDLMKNKLTLKLRSQELLLKAALGCQSVTLFTKYLTAVTDHGSLCVLRYLNHVRAAMPQDTAGGYTSALACHRAVQDALSGLFPPKG